MTVQESSLLRADLVEVRDKVAVRTYPVGPPDQESLMIAAMLSAQCPKTESGSTFLISSESSLPVRHTVRRLLRAFEVLTGKSILHLEFTFDDKRDSVEDASITNISPNGGGLPADALLEGKGGERQVMTARVNAGQTDLLSLVSSGEFARFLLAVRTRFHYVLMEGRSLRLSPETVLLAKASDGVVLTVERGVTEMANVSAAQKVARLSNIRLLGFVLETNSKTSRRAG